MNHRIIILIIAIFQFGISFSQTSSDIELLKLQIQEKDSIIKLLEKRTDSISSSLGNLKHSGKIEITSSENDSLFKFIFPSLIAILVSIIALFGTIYNGRRQRKSTKKQIERQLKSSKEVLNKQIESAEVNAELVFRQNVLSNNRQKWINDLREIVSEITSLVESNALNKSVLKQDYRKLSHLISKAELMVNPTDDEDFLKSLNDLHQGLIKIATNKIAFSEFYKYKVDLLKETKKILKTE